MLLKSLKKGLLLVLLLILFSALGKAFFQQLQHQSRAKENRLRARLVRFEPLPGGKLAVCNQDEKVALERLQVQTRDGRWIEFKGLKPLAPSGCAELEFTGNEIIAFQAKWSSEDESRWGDRLPYSPLGRVNDSKDSEASTPAASPSNDDGSKAKSQAGQ